MLATCARCRSSVALLKSSSGINVAPLSRFHAVYLTQQRGKFTLRSVSLDRLELGCSSEIDQLRRACREDGFFYLTEFGIDKAVLDNCLAAGERFFALPTMAKYAVHGSKAEVYPGTLGLPVRGYVGSTEERLGPYPGDTPEYKEAFDWAADLPVMGAAAPYHGPNLWPPSLSHEEFRKPLESFRDQLLAVGLRLLQQISLARGLPKSALDNSFTNPTLICRVLQYSPREMDDQVGCNAHTDQGFVTLLHQDSTGGLQVKISGEEWVDVVPLSGALVVNIGDTLSAHTGGLWRSTIHRVQPKPAQVRHSAALFLDPDAGAPMLPPEVVDVCNQEGKGTNEAIKVLLHKAGLGPDDVHVLSKMSFAAYKTRVFSKFLPEAMPHADFTDVKRMLA